MEPNLTPVPNNTDQLSSVAPDATSDSRQSEQGATLRILDIIRDTQQEGIPEAPTPPTLSEPHAPIFTAPQTRPVAEPLLPTPSFGTVTTPPTTPAAVPHLSDPITITTPPATPIALTANPPTIAATPTPSTPQAAPPVELPEDEAPAFPKKDPTIPSVHTLRDDMKTIVQGQNMSMVRASALEQVKRQSRAKSGQTVGSANESLPKKKGSLSRLVLFTLLLIILGGACIGAFFLYRSYSEQGLKKTANIPSTIFAEQTVPLPLERTTPAILKANLGNARTAFSASPGSMVHIVPTITDTSTKATARPATAREFFSALGVQIPLELSGALSDEFFLGIQAGDRNTPVLILSINSYERAFSGMLAWERTLSDSLVPLFTRIPVAIAAQDGSITENTFTDVIVKNYDVRVLTDPANSNALLYSFPNRQLLIITEDPYSLTEVLSRLQAARRL